MNTEWIEVLFLSIFLTKFAYFAKIEYLCRRLLSKRSITKSYLYQNIMNTFRSFLTKMSLVLGILVCSSLVVQAQSFGSFLKDAAHKAAKQAVQKAVDKVSEQQKDKSSDRQQSASQSSKQTTTKQTRQGKGAANENNEDEQPTIRLPKQHTALFEPLGYPIEDHYGSLSVKPITPPIKATAQVDWVDKLPMPYDLDNQSLIDEFQMLSKAESKGIDMNLSPAYHRRNSITDELLARCNALSELAGYHDELLGEYEMYDEGDNYNWVINGMHDRLGNILESTAYKTLIRSSLVPLFALSENYIDSKTRAYFAAHGGYQNAISVKWTKWNPRPDKEQVNTSTTGQKGTILSENSSGAHIDIAGITYILHNKGLSAFASELATTAVAGKDVVIPDYVEYKGKKYAVTDMRANLFEGTAIRSITLPATLKEIRNRAFANTPITEITIPASVKEIQGSAFYGCKNLTKVTFQGKSIEKVHGCFQNCVKLQQVVFPASMKGGMSYDMFSGCVSLTSVTLPEDLQTIPQKMFSGCKRLTTITLPKSVTAIESQAFSGCGVVSLDMTSVTELADGVFSGCSSLKTIRINRTLADKLKEENYWGYTSNFSECPHLQLKLVNDEVVFPAGVVIVDK